MEEWIYYKCTLKLFLEFICLFIFLYICICHFYLSPSLLSVIFYHLLTHSFIFLVIHLVASFMIINIIFIFLLFLILLFQYDLLLLLLLSFYYYYYYIIIIFYYFYYYFLIMICIFFCNRYDNFGEEVQLDRCFETPAQ